MKNLIAITLALIVGFHSSGREPGAAASEVFAATEASVDGGSGLAPGAITIPVVLNDKQSATTFATIDISIDPLGQPLAAFQFEVTSEDTSFTVVGVEAGEHDAFDHGRPPYFDPVATQGETDRLILAEYARPAIVAEQLPRDAIRAATVHVMFTGPLDEQEQPAIQLTLTAAGNAAGERIDAEISYTFRTPERPQ